MEPDPAEPGQRRRTWTWILAAVWLALGFWSIETGDMWLALAQVALAAWLASTAIWPRVDAWDRSLTFRRKRPSEVSAPDRE